MASHPKTEGEKIEVQELSINLTPAGDPKLGRVYSNFAVVSHSPFEFTIRFGLAPTGLDIKKCLKEDGVTVEVPAIIDVMLVPTLIPNLIKALQNHLDRFKKRFDTDMGTETELKPH